jgi:hypothetical protein
LEQSGAPGGAAGAPPAEGRNWFRTASGPGRVACAAPLAKARRGRPGLPGVLADRIDPALRGTRSEPEAVRAFHGKQPGSFTGNGASSPVSGWDRMCFLKNARHNLGFHGGDWEFENLGSCQQTRRGTGCPDLGTRVHHQLSDWVRRDPRVDNLPVKDRACSRRSLIECEPEHTFVWHYCEGIANRPDHCGKIPIRKQIVLSRNRERTKRLRILPAIGKRNHC